MKSLLTHENYQIEYFHYGSGEKILFAFHGYNNHANYFSDLGRTVGGEYSIISVNLFFHGESRAEDHQVLKGLSDSDVKEIFLMLMKKFPSEKYTLFAFSLGGRVALKFTEIFPEKVERIILLAPDGLRKTPLYWSLTQNPVGRKLFRRFVDNPEWVFKITGWLRKSGLVGESRISFALYHFDGFEKRERVYKVWLVMRNIHSSLALIRSLIRKYNIKTNLFFGEHDRIIPASSGRNLQRGVEDLVKISVLKTGHRLLTVENMKLIASELKK